MFRGLLSIGLLAACSSAPESPHPRTTGLAPFLNQSKQAGLVEVSLVATPARVAYLPGKPADVWAFRDGARADGAASVPGPLLEVQVGDRVIVHFRNELAEETTIHWHGLRVPPMSDGTPVAQMPVPPGGTFDYEFRTEDAGTFWYHPHMRADVQIERGLHGMVVVHGGARVDVSADRVFVLDDVKLESTGKLSETTEALDMMLGRQGNVLLVNGAQGSSISAGAGARERWRFVNAANGRYFNLAMPGRSFLVIGWDGGLLPRPYQDERLLIAPGERYEVLVTLGGAPGDKLVLQTLHYDRGHEIPDPGPVDLMPIELGPGSTTPLGELPTVWGNDVTLPVDARTPTRELVLSEKEAGLAEPQFFINNERYPEITPTQGRQDDVEIWSIRNDAEMDHPFHLHGMFFRVLDLDGVPPEHVGWKDTVNVPQRRTLRFAVRYGAPGRWMYHCHILEHAERGMMGELSLLPRGTSPPT